MLYFAANCAQQIIMIILMLNVE